MADVSQIKLPNGSVYDLIDEKSGYITAEYIENKTDYEIPVSRVGEIVVGETVVGTDSTNFPTSKAVVDYVDERVSEEIDAIDIPTKTSDLTNDSGFITSSSIPTSTSQLTNDSGYLTSYTETDPIFSASAAAGIGSSDITNWNGKTNTNISYDSSSRTLKKTINGTTSDVVDFGTAAFKLYTTTVTSNSTNLPTSAAVANFVENKGYLTLATLPIYDGTVE